jgi:hypothetical protein
MIALQFPEPKFRIRTQQDRKYIFDPIRRKFVFLSPEEWVRQNIISYLVGVMNYPASLLSVEKEIWVGEIKKRCDVVVFDRSGQPWMIIECKEMDMVIGEGVLQQSLTYHQALPVKYVVISNGNHTHCIRLDPVQGHEFMTVLPAYE